jgi:hypothetical protein
MSADKPDVAALIGRASPSPDDGWDAEPRPSVIPASPDVAALTDEQIDDILRFAGWTGWPDNFSPLQQGFTRDAARAAYAAASVREGAVPREPTQVMLTAGWQQVTTALCEDGNPASLCNLWRAMYDAARAKEGKP